MKIDEMKVTDSIKKYYVHIYDEETHSWVPYVYKGYTSIYEDTMKQVVNGLRNDEYKLFQSVTTRLK